MLNNKRSKKIKGKTIKSKKNKSLKKSDKDNIKLNESFEDEEIKSESSLDSEEIDRRMKTNNEHKDNKTKSNDNQIINSKINKELSADEKRLMLANKLISTLKENNDDEDNEYNLNYEIKKAKSEHIETLSNKIKSSEEINYSFIKCHLSGITSINFINDNTIITTSKDKRAFIIDLIKEQKTLIPEFTNKSLYCSAVTKDFKNIIFGGKDRKLYTYNIESNKIINTLQKAHTDAITNIKMDSNNEQVYTSSYDNNLKVWAINNYSNFIHMETFYGHTGNINDIDILGTNRVVSCGNDANIHLWKIDTQSFLQYKQGDAQYDSISTVNKEYFYTGDYLGNLKLYNINKKKQLSNIINNSSMINVNKHYPIYSLASIKNSDVVITGSVEAKINVYSADFAKPVNSLKQLQSINLLNNGIVSCLNFNKGILVAGFSKDSKNGRWDIDYNLKNSGIAIARIIDY